MEAATEAAVLYREMKDRGRFRRWEVAELARADIGVFAEYVYGIRMEPLHKLWHLLAGQYPRLVLWSPPEHGKTFQFGLVRLTYLLGKNPNMSFAHLSGTPDIPQASLAQVAKHLAKNARLHQVFPNLRLRGFKQIHTAASAVWVERPNESTDRDPSIVAMGVLGQIVGRRLDGVVLDDVLDFDNTYTKAQRDKVTARIEDEVLTRQTAEGWCVYIGHPWFKDDAGHVLANKEHWHSVRFDAEADIHGNPGPPGLWPNAWRDPQTGRLYGWPWERLMERKEDTDTLTWERVWRCRTPSESQALFPWKLLVEALERGRGVPLGAPAPGGCRPVSGIDLATGDGSDLTVITTLGRQAGSTVPLDIRGGLWDDGRLYEEMRNVLRLYPDHAGFLVEDNGMQKLVVKTTQRQEVMRAYGWRQEDLDRLRVLGFTTTGQRKAVGIRSMAVDFQQGRIVLPSDAQAKAWPQVSQLVKGLQDFDPSTPTAHTADHVMSFWLAFEMLRRTGQVGDHASRRLGLS